MKYQPLDIARQYLFVREAQSLGQNQGQRVNAIQVWAGGLAAIGTSWCCWFVTMVLDICFQGVSPIPRLGRCQDVYDLAKKESWITEVPLPGDIVLSVDEHDHAHHIAFYVSGIPLVTIGGNTDATGTSSNGDRVAEHAVSPKGKVFVRYPRG
jgi:hypothetical protein